MEKEVKPEDKYFLCENAINCEVFKDYVNDGYTADGYTIIAHCSNCDQFKDKRK